MNVERKGTSDTIRLRLKLNEKTTDELHGIISRRDPGNTSRYLFDAKTRKAAAVVMRVRGVMAAPKQGSSRRTYLATITASAVEIGCPHCGEPQPNPSDGSHMWAKDEFENADGQRRECVSCDGEFTIRHSNRVALA